MAKRKQKCDGDPVLSFGLAPQKRGQARLPEAATLDGGAATIRRSRLSPAPPVATSPAGLLAWCRDVRAELLGVLPVAVPSAKHAIVLQDLVGDAEKAMRLLGGTPAPRGPVESIQAAVRAIEAVARWCELPATADGRTEKTIWHLGDCRFRVGAGAPIAVTFQESCTLQAFVGAPALSSEDLATSSGVADARRVLCRLVQKYDKAFTGAIHLAGRKGSGGHQADVREAAAHKNAAAEGEDSTAANAAE